VENLSASKLNSKNFTRHGSLKKTPAEQAGIKLELGQNKIENLIKLASKPTP
jgi:hypothetical protein